MPRGLVLLDADGAELALDGASLDFGSVQPGKSSAPRALRVRNASDAPLHYVLLRASAHPTAQRGAAAATFEAAGFARTEHGDYAPTLELGALEPAEERVLWARWSVPAGAPSGAAVWALEATAAEP
jgi:hypothetical protein